MLPGLGVPLLAHGQLSFGLGLALATLAVVLLQHAINLYNDAADWRLGADVEKFDSWVRVHAEQPHLAVRHGTVSLLLGGLLGLLVLWQQSQWWILWLAVPLLVLGYLYNAGPRPLSYTHLGEWVTGVCYGPGVFGCLWFVAGREMDAQWLAGSVAFAALAMSLLLSHQPPQIATDREAGKLSFAVRYGADRTRSVSYGLFVMFVFAIGTGVWLAAPGWQAGLLMLIAAGFAYRLYGVPPNPKRILVAASAFILLGSWLVVTSGLLVPLA